MTNWISISHSRSINSIEIIFSVSVMDIKIHPCVPINKCPQTMRARDILLRRIRKFNINKPASFFRFLFILFHFHSLRFSASKSVGRLGENRANAFSRFEKCRVCGNCAIYYPIGSFLFIAYFESRKLMTFVVYKCFRNSFYSMFEYLIYIWISKSLLYFLAYSFYA